jgi:UDP-GlcNAc:undecaprenyl-phosphate GlcNAc-1-phosphate transferase
VGAVARPGGRNIHTQPTGRLGGLALGIGFLVAAAAFTRDQLLSRPILGLYGIAALTLILLAYDDARELRPRFKFALQVLLAILVPIVAGISITFINFGAGHVLQLGLLAVPVTVVWLIGMQNTMNLLDGVDGLAAGVAGIVAVALMLAAVNREVQAPGQVTIVLLTAALLGACVGFLFFNFHPARIFMGDSGSHFLGITLGVLSIFGIAKGAVVFALVVPVAALAVPIVDTAWAIVRRRRQKISIAHPDTAHVHHQLLDFGLSQRQTCLVFYFATGISSGVGLMFFGHRKMLAIVVVMLIVGLSTVLGQRFHEIEEAQGGRRSATPDARAPEGGPLLESARR